MNSKIATVNEWAFMASIRIYATRKHVPIEVGRLPSGKNVYRYAAPIQLFSISYLQPDVKETLKAQGRI